MRLPVIIVAAVLAGCAPPPPAVKPAPATDAAGEPWYGGEVQRLAEMNRQAKDLLERGQPDRAAAIITAAEPLENRLLSAARPTPAAMEAASDRDDLYGHMLLANHNYGWARMTFQKNVVRWKNWQPPTPESARRLKLAEAAVAECDRRMAE